MDLKLRGIVDLGERIIESNDIGSNSELDF